MRKLLSVCLTLLLLVCLAAPVSAVSGTPYVIDDAGLLTPGERAELNGYAEQIAASHGIGVYIMTVEDYRDYGEEYMIFDVLWNYYHDNRLGCGPEREGMILMLSMAERDYATFFYGEKTEYAFDSYGQEELENHFLDDFAYNDWFAGFRDYYYASESFMYEAEQGSPVRSSPWGLVGVFVLIALFISAIVTWIQWLRMSNVSIQRSADGYQTDEGLELTHKTDRFLNQTVVRRKIPQSNSSSGSRSHSGGGGSGRSGKF